MNILIIIYLQCQIDLADGFQVHAFKIYHRDDLKIIKIINIDYPWVKS